MGKPIREQIEKLHARSYKLWDSGELLDLPEKGQKHNRIILDLLAAYSYLDAVTSHGLICKKPAFAPNVMASVASGNYLEYKICCSAEQAAELIRKYRETSDGKGNTQMHISVVREIIGIQEKLFELTE